MTTYTVVNRSALADGQPMHVSDVVANFDAIASVVNGGLDDSNIGGSTAISLWKVATLIYNQVALASTWVITHNLGKYPSVDIVDSGGNIVWPDIQYTDTNTVTVVFASPTSGKAYFN